VSDTMVARGGKITNNGWLDKDNQMVKQCKNGTPRPELHCEPYVQKMDSDPSEFLETPFFKNQEKQAKCAQQAASKTEKMLLQMMSMMVPFSILHVGES
jgi:hypothetical protein